MAFRWRFTAVLVAVLAGGGWLAASFVGRTSALEGLVYDVTLRAVAGLQPDAGAHKVAIVALDRRSLQSPRLQALPRALMAPVFAETIAALREAGAQQIGFDLVLAWSAGQLLPDHDRPLIAQLAAAQGQVVLGRTATTAPARPFYFSVGAHEDPAALGLLELPIDQDGIARRVRGRWSAPDGDHLTLVGAMAQRLGIPAEGVRGVLAPTRPLAAMPSFSLIDVLDCAQRDPGALRRAFSGRAVLIGSSLPDEDIKRTLDRFLAPPAARSGSEGCLKPASSGPARVGRVPGIYLHAAALDAALRDRLAVPTSPRWRKATSAGMAAAGGLLGLSAAPWAALIGVVVLLAGLGLVGGLLLGLGGIWLPFAVPAVALAAAASLVYGGRFVLERRRRRLIRQAFGHYLAPALVAEIAERETLPELGGHTRHVSVMFADLSGFTELSGRLPANDLVKFTNSYFDLIATAVEAEGGYVDKFIGDAVMAIWGAPLANPDHAERAVSAALRIADAVESAGRAAEREGAPAFRIKIAVNSGPAVAGNIGSAHRLNYTVVGETVNLAARLEAVPGQFDCNVVLGPTTARAVADSFVVYELDCLRFKGLNAPVAVYEALCARADAGPKIHAYVDAYGRGLAAWRAGDTASAGRLWRQAVYPRPSATGGPPVRMAAEVSELD